MEIYSIIVIRLKKKALDVDRSIIVGTTGELSTTFFSFFFSKLHLGRKLRKRLLLFYSIMISVMKLKWFTFSFVITFYFPSCCLFRFSCSTLKFHASRQGTRGSFLPFFLLHIYRHLIFLPPPNFKEARRLFLQCLGHSDLLRPASLLLLCPFSSIFPSHVCSVYRQSHWSIYDVLSFFNSRKKNCFETRLPEHYI